MQEVGGGRNGKSLGFLPAPELSDMKPKGGGIVTLLDLRAAGSVGTGANLLLVSAVKVRVQTCWQRRFISSEQRWMASLSLGAGL